MKQFSLRNAILFVSACGLVTLIVAQAARLLGGAQVQQSFIHEGLAQAGEVVSSTGGLTILTTDAGVEDMLIVLDTRNEELLVYRTDVKAGMQLLQRYAVSQLFLDARARSLGR